MKNRFLLSTLLVLLFVALFVPTSYSQNPTFTCNIYNATWDGHKVFTFDIYICNTSANYFELAGFQAGLLYDNTVKNGGTMTAAWVANSQNDLVASERAGALNTTTAGCIKVAGKTAPGAGNGTVIDGQIHGTNNYPGVRVGRITLTNTVDFLSPYMKINYNMTASPYLTAVTAYVSSLSTNVTANGTFGPGTDIPLPVELTSFASTSQGRTVVLNWSTKTEKNSDRFEVERSLVANENWSTVGSVKASVLSNSPKSYSYSDTKLQSGKYQYRLKMVDNNGSFSYSTVEAAEVAVPKDFSVSQNYPNPFNPSTKIDYQVPVDAKVIMEVYNIAGQKVMELVNGQMSAGYYTVDFGASKLSSGVYIYRLAASDVATGHNFSSIKKMMLLK